MSLPPSPGATIGQPYQVAAVATGNVGAVVWSIASGTLPAGVTLDPATGVIAGTPTAWGTCVVVVQGADSWGANRVDSKPLTIGVSPNALAITTTALAAAMYKTGYQAALTTSGGTGSVSFSIVSGALPAGLSMNADGVVSGTPMSVGTFSIGVQAVDTNWTSNTATKTITLVVQVDGKVRDRIDVSADVSEEAARELALASENAKRAVGQREIAKVIVRPPKLVNIVPSR